MRVEVETELKSLDAGVKNPAVLFGKVSCGLAVSILKFSEYYDDDIS